MLRTAFDKLCGLRVTAGFRTPKRPQPLRDILAPEEARRLLAAARSARDRLALGLLHGCGLKVGELCALRVTDADPDTRTLTVTFAGGTRRRSLPIPENLLPLLRAEMSFELHILPPDLVSPADRLSISLRVQQPMRPASAPPCLAGGP